ncbi:hypothetical protein [Pseudomonas quasicaspiana]|jgi:hypothetical protein|uniref:hypothetical protein n=1 Tax=Pseudomonas quasicaspiana TaxID=2829821 RepID=UPI001E4C05A0|nr:hypothetical protein [Pseudomonas quasicaspiana]MCD5977039.1 hypothetical protein [Pseudomonas quasicaspiana]
MKTCMISGDLFSDSAAEQYPTVNLCDECVADDAKREGEQHIFEQGEYQPDYGETCEWCGKTDEEEALAWVE